ncbi:hypothetical protein C8R44DRAFT_880130 [Mycena epipterygia]|nr:hypothetical protein C8R44DRAFT_880130 [Mycena epipterygia]
MSWAPPVILDLSSFSMLVPPIPRRTSSDITHVSDSEPEREACRRRPAQFPSPPDSPPAQRTPLAGISNVLLRTDLDGLQAIETRLSRLEGEIAEIKHSLAHGKRSRIGHSPPSTPLPKRRRILPDETTHETPILRRSLMVSTPEREQLSRWVSDDIQHSLRECQCQHLNRDRVNAVAGPSRRGKLRRRAQEFLD